MREWIVTNGLGSYASLTHSNLNTRKFHGLLIASLNPPTQRWVFVSNIEDKLKFFNKLYDLKEYTCKFNYDIVPTFTYDLEEINLTKKIFMVYGKNTTIIKYSIKTKDIVEIIHNPIINSRHFYDLTKSGTFSIKQNILDNGVLINPNNINKTLKIILKNSNYKIKENWKEYHYEKDRERNDSYIDYNLNTGEFYKKIQENTEYYLILTLENNIQEDVNTLFLNEMQRKKNLLNNSGLPIIFKNLVLSTDNFIVKKGSRKSIIAGYHWFGDWGRDTLISLPGLTLVTGRFNIAKEILLELKDFCNNGLIPNVFIDKNSEVSYNTVDASLWYIDRVFQYLKYTNDRIFLNDIWNTLKSIVDAYKEGTDFGIYMGEDFLINHNPGITWMDVKLGDYYSTPRTKKAVEIQALWYNSLKIMSTLAKILGKNDKYLKLSDKVKENFNWEYDQQYDVIDKKDLSFRPNQIFLVSLDFNMIESHFQEKIVKEVQEELLTIFGLRTLSKKDSRYIGKYIGSHNRDIAYHNGIVWPWLLGPFIKSFIKTKNNELIWREYAYKKFLEPMLRVFGNNWDGSINEIFDGDPPYQPRGCITQAWSVAELLRTWVEDIENISPMYHKIFSSHEICI